jgi:hypothetical protein
MELLIGVESAPSPELEKILQAHWGFCNASTPAEHVYAVEAAKLFKPARALYTSLGFKNSDAFGDYVLSEDNICMSKEIE